MSDMIAVLEGLSRSLNVSGSGGANRSGGSDFYPGAPTMPSSEGLASFQTFAPGSIEEAYAASGIRDGWDTDGRPVQQSQDDYHTYLAAFANGTSFTATRGSDSQLNPSGSGGANYSGGSDFYSGAPTLPSSEGLAAGDVVGGYEVTRQLNPSGSGGAQYSGGSSFYPGAPTLPSSEGLAVIALHGMLGMGVSPAVAVRAARQAVGQVDRRQTPCDQAYQAAYAAALVAGYDRQWAASAASRVLSRCQAVGWQIFATKR